MTEAAHQLADREIGLSQASRDYFGLAFPAVEAFADALASEGEVRGLIGPREIDRLWTRHLFNSAAVVPFLPTSGVIADVGSGAGLPGIVVAAMRPEAEVVLIEPMDRRCVWLRWVADELGLENVDVRRGRAEEYHGAFEADAVTARAVAALDKLARLTLPLLGRGGVLVALKGRSAEQEVAAATKTLRRFGGGPAEVLQASTIEGVDDTVVVRVARETIKGS
ncbi:16S rRNA (guanine(527)-N(7))-methyltransferase RsmG [Luteimicrobium subarcticum]|uniref:Ribosomal RNA small subunit methyltransferase G n=1 Tax=Luteimicrobium subarcticum TaxID=620910 RepID=A0A2M8WJG9_9MICO|nr:16S rRNA (guanine(527)-N(7))-methyltransferase RsmG [Luteimicrobium subarcticum]PJI91074.1 16S rRNA m(7)G-527 methyltransferase [Luteimicrobium subarcticum]